MRLRRAVSAWLVGALSIGAAGCSGPIRAAAPPSCPAATFTLPTSIPGSNLTGPAENGHYRHLGAGQEDIVAIGPPALNSVNLAVPIVVLHRGVSDDDFAVSAFAHGPAPLVRLTVLGQAALLYPATDTGAASSRIPFVSGPDRVRRACSRWELSGGVSDAQLATFAEAIQPSGPAATACSAAAIGAGVGRYTRYSSLDRFGCAGSFAYAFTELPAPTPAGGVEETVLLKMTSTGWAEVDRTTSCENGSVPTAIVRPACDTS